MITRVSFDHELLHAIHVRGLTFAEVACRARLSVATVSAAAQGHPVNMRTALLLSQAVASCPVVPELAAWLAPPRMDTERPTNR